MAGGTHAEFDMEVSEFEKNKKLAMRTIGASKFKMNSSYTFEPTAKGTKLTSNMEYELPYSVLGKLVDKIRVGKDIEKSQTRIGESMKKALER